MPFPCVPFVLFIPFVLLFRVFRVFRVRIKYPSVVCGSLISWFSFRWWCICLSGGFRLTLSFDRRWCRCYFSFDVFSLWCQYRLCRCWHRILPRWRHTPSCGLTMMCQMFYIPAADSTPRHRWETKCSRCLSWRSLLPTVLFQQEGDNRYIRHFLCQDRRRHCQILLLQHSSYILPSLMCRVVSSGTVLDSQGVMM